MLVPYCILSYDGGGIRGEIPAEETRRIMLDVPGLIDGVDMIAGTSTGGILACALAAGFTGEQLVALYRDNAGKIFLRGFLDKVQDLGGLEGSLYDNENLEAVLTEQFGDMRLGDLKKEVLITSVATDRIVDGVRMMGPKFWSRKKDPNARVVDVCLYTSAAPVYFKLKAGLIRGRVTPYVDGGMFANNPSEKAIEWAIRNGVPRKSIVMLSMGTGLNPHWIQTIEGVDLDWGVRDWGLKLLTVAMEPSAVSAHVGAEWLLAKNKYFRLNPVLKEDIPLDDVAAVPDLIEIGAQVDIGGAVAFLKERWKNPADPVKPEAA